MRRLIAALAALLLAACMPVAKAPSVTLAGLDIESIGLFEQRFILTLRVQNPNDIDIPIEGLNFAVEVGGQPFATGASNQAVTIPRLGEGSGLDYRIKGQLQIAGHGSVPFDSKGQMPFLRLPGGEEKSAPKRLPGAV